MLETKESLWPKIWAFQVTCKKGNLGICYCGCNKDRNVIRDGFRLSKQDLDRITRRRKKSLSY